MSRINYHENDGDFTVLDQGRWERNSLATVNSKRGQKVLRELLQILEAMPVKELADDVFAEKRLYHTHNEATREPCGVQSCTDGGFILQGVEACVLGQYALSKGLTYEDLARLNGEDAEEQAAWISGKLGIAYTLAWNLIELNDEAFSGCTPADRWRRMRNYVWGHIKGIEE